MLVLKLQRTIPTYMYQKVSRLFIMQITNETA